MTTYEQKPYRTVARPESHPERLSAIARSMDLPASNPDSCRVLELGCGTGGNILPWAERYAESTFTAIDNASNHIDVAQHTAQQMNLRNIEFRVDDISSCSLKKASYDYIVCHGVYSWVSEPVQQKILEVCKEALAPNGVVLISYNVLPGWRQRGLIRDIMMFGASLEQSPDPEKKLQSAARTLGLVAAARREKDDLYGRYLNEAISRLQSSDSSYLFHEFLEEHNSPCLFTDFMQKAKGTGLQFLSEARPAFMAGDDLGHEQRHFLDSLAADVIMREQALDIFRNRMLRETILCHEGHTLKRDLRASVFRSLVYSTEYRRVPSSSSGEVKFRDLVSAREIAMPKGDSTDVLDLVGRLGPSGCNLSELARSASEISINCRSEAEIFSNIVALWRAGFIELSSAHYPALSKASGLAKTSKLARIQAQSGESATSLRHRHYELSSPERLILAASDGTRDFEDVMTRVESVAKGTTAGAVERLLALGFFQ